MKTEYDTQVKKFNALPRKAMAPSGLVPNHWHFELRYISIEPPSHILFLFQVESNYTHMERLPLGSPPNASGMSFFPETGKEAAPEVAKALIHSFLNGLSGGLVPYFAPWKLTTEDASLAAAVGDEFKKLGIRRELWTIHTVSGRPLIAAQAAFKQLYDMVKTQIGLVSPAIHAFEPPSSIIFLPKSEYRELRDEELQGDKEGEEFQKILNYNSRLHSGRPAIHGPFDVLGHQEEIERSTRLINEKSTEDVRKEADSGNGMSAIDYALRLQYGIKCSDLPNRAVIREYLMKAITSPSSNSETKSLAHSLLIEWYIHAFKPEYGPPVRYLFTAAHHANQAVELSSGKASPGVLMFGSKALEPLAEKVVQLYAQFSSLWKALDRRKQELEKDIEKGQMKRMKAPNRYRCANVGCPVQSNKGKMLQRCAGKCDVDKKPSYCCKACQKADWPNHKPFCKPGMPCSVIDPEPDFGMYSTRDGALSIPIVGPDGKTTLLSSSTLSAETLKEWKEHVEQGSARNSK